MPDNTYFANLTGAELTAKLKERFDDFEQKLANSGDLDKMLVAIREYFGEDEKGNSAHRISTAGSQDQLRNIKTGHFGSAVQMKMTLVTAEEPTYVPVAKSNTDADTQKQVLVAKGLLDWRMSEGGVAEVCEEATEQSEILSWAWVDVWWDKRGGQPAQAVGLDGKAAPVTEPVLDEEGNPVGERPQYEGEARVDLRLPVDVAFAFSSRGELSWVIIRSWRNRWDVAAEAEEAGNHEAAEAARGLSANLNTKVDALYRYSQWAPEEDEIPVYEFRHLDRPAVPGGKAAKYLETGHVLEEGELPYKDLSCYMQRSARRFGTPRGYTRAHDVLGLCRAVDVLTSIPYSNARGLGGQMMWGKEAPEIQDVTEALTWVISHEKPEPLMMHRADGGLAELRQEFIRDIGTGVGMDDFSMGRDQQKLAGVAMALLDTKTQRAVSRTAKAHVRLLQKVADALIRLYRDFAAHSRTVAMVVGRTKKPMLRAFTRADIAGIDRITIETSSPLMRSPAGRVEVAKMLMDMKSETGVPAVNPEQFMAVLETGKYEPLTEAPMSRLMRIREENEKLAAGEPVIALWTDPHPLEVPEHLTVLDSPDARENPAIAQGVYEHINQHLALMDPSAAQMLLQQLGVAPPPQAMGPGAAPGAAPPPGGGGGAAPPGVDAAPPADGPGLPKMPNGETYTPTGEISNG